MKPQSSRCTSTTVAALIALQAISLGSQPVPVTNAGFENPVLADGGFQAAPIPGWSNIGPGDRGLLNPTTSDFPTEAPEGSNVAYVANTTGEAGVSQALGGSTGQLQVGATYALRVKVGNSACCAKPTTLPKLPLTTSNSAPPSPTRSPNRVGPTPFSPAARLY